MANRPGEGAWPAAVAVVWVSSVAALFLSLQPLLVGRLVDAAGMTLQQAANVPSANMLGTLAGSALTLLLLGRFGVRRLMLLGIALFALGELLSAVLVASPAGLAAARLVAGCGMGISIAGAAATVVALPSPERVFAAMVFFQALSGAALLLAAPELFESIGVRGVFVTLATLAVVSCATIPFYAQPAPRHEARVPGTTLISLPTLMLLGSLFVYYVANNGVWAHFERVGVDAGVPTHEISAALSIGQLCSLAGALAAAILSARISRRAAIGSGVVGIAIATAMLLGIKGPSLLLASVALFMGSICFVVPFYLGALAALDASGRFVVMGNLALMGGLFLGPALAAAVATRSSLQSMLVFSIALFAVALILALMALKRGTVSCSTEGVTI